MRKTIISKSILILVISKGAMIMELKKCRDCGTLFQYNSGPMYCTRCKQNHETLIKDIKDYLYDYPNTDIKMLSEDLNISAKLIESFIRSGRIELSLDSPIKIVCDVCGTRISSGRLCEDCQDQTTNSFVKADEAYEKNKRNAPGPVRMHRRH